MYTRILAKKNTRFCNLRVLRAYNWPFQDFWLRNNSCPTNPLCHGNFQVCLLHCLSIHLECSRAVSALINNSNSRLCPCCCLHVPETGFLVPAGMHPKSTKFQNASLFALAFSCLCVRKPRCQEVWFWKGGAVNFPCPVTEVGIL